jgi:hypothetical protein
MRPNHSGSICGKGVLVILMTATKIFTHLPRAWGELHTQTYNSLNSFDLPFKARQPKLD